MSEYLDGGGVVIEEDTGAIISRPVGDHDWLAWLAERFLDASEQERQWDREKRTLSRAFVANQPEKSAAYGDVVVNVPTPGVYKEFDAGTWATWVASQEDLSREDLLYVLARSKPDYTQFPPGHLRDLVLSFYVDKVRAAYATARRARKVANLRVVEPEAE